MPELKAEGEGGPRSVKCHSNRLDSRGDAWRSGEGFEDSSAASLTMVLHVSAALGSIEASSTYVFVLL
jgi:hypothetical protein